MVTPAGGAGTAFDYDSGDIVCGSVVFRSSGELNYSSYASGPLQWRTPIQSGSGDTYTLQLVRTSGLSFSVGNNVTLDMNEDIDVSCTGGAGSTTGDWTIRDGDGFARASGTIFVTNAI